MVNPWITILQNLSLSRTESEVVKRFERDPEGRTFLPIADILRAHKLHDESLELLTQGVARHPQFTVARVVLARELLQKGMVGDAWRILDESPVNLRDNLLAQKLRFRLAVLLSLDDVVLATVQHLKVHQMLDADSKRLADAVELSGVDVARQKLIEELKARGIDPVIPEDKPNADVPAEDAQPMREAVAQEDALFQEHYFDSDDELSGFHVVPLDEIFRPGDSAAPRGMGGGVELDSTTLADIYVRQEHYGKALSVFRRLLKMSPNNDYLRRKVAEIARLEREQRETDLEVDPAIVDRMETIEIIDKQIRFYNDLLARLS